MSKERPSHEYEIDWYKIGYTSAQDFNPINLSTCVPCNFPIRNKRSNSQRNDVVLTSAFSKTYNVVPFTRSLRTTGSKASILIFVDVISEYKINHGETGKFLRSCGVTCVLIGLISQSRHKLLTLRNSVIYDFLKLRQNFLYRGLILDLYDTIFQGDPFHKDLNESEIGITIETEPCDSTQQWGARLLFGPIAYLLIKKPCVNAGTIIGSIPMLVRYLEFYTAYLNSINPIVLKKIKKFPDQVIMNLLVGFELTEIPLHLYKVTDEYVGLWDVFNSSATFKIGHFKMPDQVEYPLVVHLFDRSLVFYHSILNSCPQLFPVSDNYTRIIYAE